jgi:lambda family phage portal protein
MSLLNRALRAVGLQPVPKAAPHRHRPFNMMNASYQAAQIDRLTQDWVVAVLSPDQEIRVALRNLRGRARQLAINNPHCKRFLNAAKEQVIGAAGVSLEMSFPDQDSTPGAQLLAAQIEKQWSTFSDCVTADQKMGLTELAQLWLASVLQDGEGFVHKLEGYPYNDFEFAVQLIDPDQVDVNWMRLKSPQSTDGLNEIRMGVEVDRFRRPVAYWLYEGHPSEFTGVVRKRVPAEQIDHGFQAQRVNQTRGVPAMHAAMFLMNMLGEYDKAEVVASRWAACKMAFLISETGDEYDGGDADREGGPVKVSVEPGSVEELPKGVEPRVVDWQHPAHNYENFSLACLRGISAGLNISYTTLTGDLRAVNFSSIRQGVLQERDGWAGLQGFSVQHFYRPLFRGWLKMAVLTGKVLLPPGVLIQDVVDAALWTPRGWDWVDPYKDSQASMIAIRSGLSTYQKECAKRGLDWRKNFKQRKAENDFAEELGLALDLTTSGAGGIEGDTGSEDPQRAAEPTKPGAPPPKKTNALAQAPVAGRVALPATVAPVRLP